MKPTCDGCYVVKWSNLVNVMVIVNVCSDIVWRMMGGLGSSPNDKRLGENLNESVVRKIPDRTGHSLYPCDEKKNVRVTRVQVRVLEDSQQEV